MFRDDLLRGFLHVADAGVIAEAFPKLVDFVGAGIGEAFNGGQLAQPAFPIRNHCFHLCLLQHDFGHPDGVGIAGAPPRKVACVGGEPVKQQRDELRVFNFRIQKWRTTKYTKHAKSERRIYQTTLVPRVLMAHLCGAFGVKSKELMFRIIPLTAI